MAERYATAARLLRRLTSSPGGLVRDTEGAPAGRLQGVGSAPPAIFPEVA